MFLDTRFQYGGNSDNLDRFPPNLYNAPLDGMRSTTFNSGPPHYRGCALARKGSPWRSDGRHRPSFSSFSRVTPNRIVMWLRAEACSSGSSD